VLGSLQSDTPSWLAQGQCLDLYNLICLAGMLRGRLACLLAQRSAVGHLVFEEREDIVCRDQRSVVWKTFYLSGRGGYGLWMG